MVQNRTQVEVQRDARSSTAVIPWKNLSGEEIPAHAVVHMRGQFESGSASGRKPNAKYGLFFVNGSKPIASGKMSESMLWDRPRSVLVDGLVAVGQEVGPVIDQWYMSSTGVGFRVVHQPVNGVATVIPAASEKAAPDDAGCGCECVEEYDLIIQQDDPTAPPIRTVRRWSVEYKEPVVLVFGQYTVTMPAGVYSMAWRQSSSDWFLDVGDYLTVTDGTGADVTSSVILDGTLTLSLPAPGEQSELQLCVSLDTPVTPPGY